MVKARQNIIEDLKKLLGSNIKNKNSIKTYISLFSSAGVGCYGFKEEDFYCIATVELLEKRLKFQTYNNKCILPSGYICGDMTQDDIKNKIFEEIKLWKNCVNINDVDVLVATPPCQGMSIANHKKKDELKRNSLVVESIKTTVEIKPRFFIFENVRAFLTSICTDLDGTDKTIKEAIDLNLSGKYNILYQVINFKDYGSPSSRTRTLVIGVRKDIKEITPYDIFPEKKEEKTLRQTIGFLPSLKKMGEISPEDIYHNFRKYNPEMEAWISEIREGQSAFDNVDKMRIPHTIKDGKIVYNVQKNGDKYTRQYWNKVAPCIHTRNDIMASQNTVHPEDNRVFSIREVMLMMSVPYSFNWTNIPFSELNKLSIKEKELFLKKEEINIRQSLGEAVPTVIFQQIAQKIKKILDSAYLTEQEVKKLIKDEKLTVFENLKSFIEKNENLNFVELAKIAELTNAERENNAAYYTRQDICYNIVNSLPEAKGFSTINIIEPSIGVGNFLPSIIKKYESVSVVNIDVVDIDKNSLQILKLLVEKLYIPENVNIRFIEADFLKYEFDKTYDVVVGNPPYMKLKDKKLISEYKRNAFNKDTNNIFSFFIEKSLKIGKFVSLVVPKSLINAPEFNLTRSLIDEYRIKRIIDFGEKAFKGVKIETINIAIECKKKQDTTIVESLITEKTRICSQRYITDRNFPYWLIYRDEEFDKISENMEFNIFKAYRDRKITKAITEKAGKYRVLKSRNIVNNDIINIPSYDSYVNDISNLDVAKYLNNNKCVLIPNLSYYPRACFMPNGCITDGSVAILSQIDESIEITKEDLAFYSTEEFSRFYAIARNRGTRSLNIDNNSVFFFGKLKDKAYENK